MNRQELIMALIIWGICAMGFYGWCYLISKGIEEMTTGF